MAQRGAEKGIKEGEDYGSQFLDARADDGAPPAAPPPAPSDGGPGDDGGRNIGQIVLIAVIVAVVIGGGVAAFALTSGGDGSGDNLATASPGVSISDDERPGRTTTTTEATTTTTTEATTTTTESTTTTTASTVPTTVTIAGFPAPTAPPATGGPVFPNPTPAPRVCPAGSVANQTTSAKVTLLVQGPPHKYQVDVTGQTTNNTNAAIVMAVNVPISYTLGGAFRDVTPLPDKFGSSVAPGATLTWVLSYPIESDTQPSVGALQGGFTWADPTNAGCAVS